MMWAHRMNFFVQLFLPETTLAARDVVGTVRTPDADCLIWIKGTTSPPNRMATLKQTSHQIRRPQAGTGLIRLPRSVPAALVSAFPHRSNTA